MESRFTTIHNELTMLNKVYTNKEMCMKILRALLVEWSMKVTAMRETKNLTTTTIFQLFSDLKAYEFEFQNQDIPKTNPQAVQALAASSQKSKDKGKEDLYEQMALLIKKFKKFSRYTKKFHKEESSRRPYKQDRDEEDEKKKEDRALCYNFKKYTDEERRAWKEKKDKEIRKERKAMKASDHEEETKKKKEESSSDESSSSSSSSEEALLCLMAQSGDEDEVTSRINSSSFSSTSPHCEQDMQTMFQELLARFEEIQASHEALLKENESLKGDKERLKKELDKAIPVFDKVVGNSGKAGLGFKGKVGQPLNEAKEAL
ncbi:hypothetical protein Dimus_031811 [Dionaea muscipula]